MQTWKYHLDITLWIVNSDDRKTTRVYSVFSKGSDLKQLAGIKNDLHLLLQETQAE